MTPIESKFSQRKIMGLNINEWNLKIKKITKINLYHELFKNMLKRYGSQFFFQAKGCAKMSDFNCWKIMHEKANSVWYYQKRNITSCNKLKYVNLLHIPILKKGCLSYLPITKLKRIESCKKCSVVFK